MVKPFVILTGASGVGKTAIAQAIEDGHPEIAVYRGDPIGLPPEEILAGYGPANGPGGPTQRGFALYWIGEIAAVLKADRPVLLETQCRIAFLHEALAVHGIQHARIVLLECSDSVRTTRLKARGQPHLANEDMANWSRFLHREAKLYGHEVLDTSALRLDACASHILRYLED
jgi:dephospho-CoA kinase